MDAVSGGYISFVGLLIIPICLILFAGSIVFQVFLSKLKSKLPGLVLPSISFLISLIIVAILLLNTYHLNIMSLIFALLMLIPLNIPTMILLLIYFLSRKKLNADNSQEMKKMTIQDLE